MTGRYVVILTGGALPGQETPGPGRLDADLAMERAGHAGLTGTEAVVARQAAAAAFKLGYEHGARDHRTVAVWVLDDKTEAGQFAGFVTREIDPAHVIEARSPLGEVFTVAEGLRDELCRRDQADDAAGTGGAA